MQGPPPSHDEMQARLYRYVRHPRFADVPFRDAVFRAADDFDLSPFEIFDRLGESDL